MEYWILELLLKQKLYELLVPVIAEVLLTGTFYCFTAYHY